MFYNPYDVYQRGQSVQFVNGVASLNSVMMMPNSQQIFMDKSLPRFYFVETDASGQKDVTSYDFVKTPEARTEGVSREEFDSLRSDYESIVQRLAELSARLDAGVAEQRPAGSEEPPDADGQQRAD